MMMTKLRRRTFLQLAGALSAFSAAAIAAPARLAVVVEPRNAVAAGTPVAWALDQLRQALTASGAGLKVVSAGAACTAGFVLVVAGAGSALASGFPRASAPTDAAEHFHIAPGRFAGKPALLVSASDSRGFVYALLELAERVQFGGAVALHLKHDIAEAPANTVRSVARAFCSEIEDKPWYYDKDFWRAYLDMLVASRFNRFNFFLGIGYDFPRGVTDDYFHFPYPYLVTVPGYDVRAVPLADGERERNFAMLQFIAQQTVQRGLEFQLGLWTHAYQWTDSPNSTHHIAGLTPETHAPYCRDALAALLQACPEISGLTLRIHGESGIPEGSYPFWQTLFDAIPGAGRPIEIDMHAKGLNQIMIDMAAKTGMPVKAGCKYSAEHQSLGYHQADIRPTEIPKAQPPADATFAVSEGDRSFTRYGYADLYQEGRKYDVLYRLWPGTQHHLMWGDPAQAAAFGRTAHFCGAAGFELMEPLTFKGREGSGHPGGRCAYADQTLDPGINDFTKFAATYRLWGRLLYNPDAQPDAWRRDLARRFGPRALAAEEALAQASRVMPLLTSAHLPSASNHDLEYELAANMPVVPGGDAPYNDTPEPKLYGHASPLDPQLFSTIADHAADLVAGHANGKYSPAEIALWVDGLVTASSQALDRAGGDDDAEFHRLAEDVRIVNGMGRYYAAKLRAALLFEIWNQTGDPRAGSLAVALYAQGLAAWSAMAERAKTVYVADITYGRIQKRRGHWADRIPDIQKDIAAMRAAVTAGTKTGTAGAAIAAVLKPPPRPVVACRHDAPADFHPGAALPLTLVADGRHEGLSARLFYRHVNHAERWRTVEMTAKDSSFVAAVPDAYTASPFPLQYYFELSRGTQAWLYPGFNPTLSNQPYYAVWKRRA